MLGCRKLGCLDFFSGIKTGYCTLAKDGDIL